MSNETTAGPYTVDLSGHWVMTNIGTYREVEHFDLPSQAKIVCEELNTAYAAGQASREQQWTTIVESALRMGERYLVADADMRNIRGLYWTRTFSKDLVWTSHPNAGETFDTGLFTYCAPLPSPPNKQP